MAAELNVSILSTREKKREEYTRGDTVLLICKRFISTLTAEETELSLVQHCTSERGNCFDKNKQNLWDFGSFYTADDRIINC